MDRQTLGTVGMGYGVTGVEHQQYLVDTSQPYAEVIQEAEWVNNALPLITRYDIGLDRLRMFKSQVTSHGPPPVYSPVLSGWYLFDGLGSTRAVVDDSGVGQSEFGYGDAFGIPYQVAANGTRSTAGAGFFLNGQQWDGSGVWNSGEGLYFNRARYYQPNLGRFIGSDPHNGQDYEPDTLHKYRYSANNPVGKIDPSGRFDISLLGTTIANFISTSVDNLDTKMSSAVFKYITRVNPTVQRMIYYGHGGLNLYFMMTDPEYIAQAAATGGIAAEAQMLKGMFSAGKNLFVAFREATILANGIKRAEGMVAYLVPEVLRKAGTRTNPLRSILPPGWDAIKNSGLGNGPARAHLWGDEIGGPHNIWENFVAMYQSANKRMYDAVEFPIKQALEAGKRIHYSVTPVYEQGIEYPVRLICEAVSDDGTWKLGGIGRIIIENIP